MNRWCVFLWLTDGQTVSYDYFIIRIIWDGTPALLLTKIHGNIDLDGARMILFIKRYFWQGISTLLRKMFCNDAQNPLKTPMISSAQYFQTLEELSFWLPTIKILIMTKKCSLIILKDTCIGLFRKCWLNRKFAEPAFPRWPQPSVMIPGTSGTIHHYHPLSKIQYPPGHHPPSTIHYPVSTIHQAFIHHPPGPSPIIIHHPPKP